EPIGAWGISTLMFMIGLELSLERLRTMRRLVFGLGASQVALCALGIMGAAAAWGLPAGGAAVTGLALSMSSTAIVVQVLVQEKRLGGAVGRSSLAALLFQDIAAVPVLFAVSVLGTTLPGGGGPDLLATVGQALAVVLGLIAGGRLLLRPLFRGVARTGTPELFIAACLLVILATSLATATAGLPMELGALIAGLLLAETEYRRQIEVTIEPIKGLLVGVFLVYVGMSLDLQRVALNAPALLGGAALLILSKAGIAAGLARGFGLPWRAGLQTGLLLGPGGEFGFVILGLARAEHLLGDETAGALLIVVALSMACIPPLSALGRRIERRAARAGVEDPGLLAALPDDASPRAILAGFGRVGETVAELLETHRIPYIAVDTDPDRVAEQRAKGRHVIWGDITRVEMLRRLHLETARALVVTMNDRAASDRLVAAARSERADLLVVARAHDARHAAHLYAVGATHAVPETVEASLQLSEAVLTDLGVPMGPVLVTIHGKRDAMQAEIRAMAPGAAVRPLGRQRLSDRLPRPG
ncbi:MAG: cation:proton antiporter, partial [Proteobacteria bacterium]|nr:cation:proton antiporter [Pseudomonadota bacterium]